MRSHGSTCCKDAHAKRDVHVGSSEKRSIRNDP